MPFKDEFGIWRRDLPTLDKYDVIHCKRCGNEMETELLTDVDDWDGQMEQDYPDLSTEPGDVLYCYQRCYAECLDCGHIFVYGPRWYWNPTTGSYDLPRPLSYEQAKQAEAEASRTDAKAAGQLELWGDQS